MRHFMPICAALFLALQTQAQSPSAPIEAGVVSVQVKGTLQHNNNHYSVLARNTVSNEIFSVALMRSEDKRRDMDDYLAAHADKVVSVKGVLAYYPHRMDNGPDLAIELIDLSQFSE